MVDLKGKRVGVLGAGVENVPLIHWLVRQGAQVTVADQKRQKELASFHKLRALPVEFRLGPAYLDKLTDFKVVFRTPMLPVSNLKLQAAARAGVVVSSQTKLFFELCPAPIIGVTGTNGKGTTSSLIYEMLKAAGKRVLLGGNIGRPPIDFIDELTGESIVVLELSSFQLEDLEQSPHIAVVLGITPDHLDRHRTFTEYVEAKKNIVKYQSAEDAAVICIDYPPNKEFTVATKSQVYLVSQKKVTRGAVINGSKIDLSGEGEIPLVKAAEIKLPGVHNMENIAAAALAARLAGADPDSIKGAARAFRGLPHRLELVSEVGQVKFFDDSIATTPAPTIAAIKSFPNPLILICGGSSKKSDFTELGKLVAKSSTVKDVILLGDVEAPKIRAAVEKERGSQRFFPVMNMDAAVKTAVKLAQPGDIVLLSPACASFDLFKDYKDRGNQFKEAVKIHARA